MLQKFRMPKRDTTILSFEDTNVDLESFGTCPICGKQISPKFKYAYLSHYAKSLKAHDVISNSQVNALYECPDCHNGILVYYKVLCDLQIPKYGKEYVVSNWKTFTIKSIFPTAIAQFPYNDIISKVSSRFKDIYVQSLQAKLDGKNELVGIGYRKSIEFLIKDYLLHIKHEKSVKIPNLPLGECIKLIDSPKIQTLAKASTWLGNDETHYVRKHTDKDICDLEKFLDALVYYLTYELTVEEASSFIDKS
ncbi:hypothetical protein [Thomasclavelia ramosa]|uniref:hypothetical protein n=1 Tax=Thomasclavelia ramosa TaxID=1547 RepID=UPI0032C1EC19